MDQHNFDTIRNNAEKDIKTVNNLEDFKVLKNKLIGDQSELAKINREIGNLEATQKAVVGQLVSKTKNEIQSLLEAKLQEINHARENELLSSETVDVTEVVATKNRFISDAGSRHPINSITYLISEIFSRIGYEVAEGPEAESTWFNFDSLNISENHPSRSPSDTFYIDDFDSGIVLRTQTSPVQMRVMLEQKPPIYIISPGKVFRFDELDATHTPVFHQVEGLAIDKDLTMSDLKGTLDYFATSLFGSDVETRFRPSYFPFTEPSAEIDFKCFVCKGNKNISSCKVCKGEGWIEWGGCGMVNPNVLLTAGIDPKQYTGFAFGMGIERTLMLRHGVQTMHYLVEADVRFNSSFGLSL
ncbi:MAG: phenylalanine--tRNA ligase subunit alpha [Actinomycetes bacterium]